MTLNPRQLVDHLGRPFQPQASSGSRFEGARANRLMMDWVISSLGTNPLPWELDTLRDRSRDRALNDPIAASIPQTITVNVVGPGLQPQSRLRAEKLGISEDAAEELQAQAEAVFDLWQPQADAAGRLDFAEVQALVMRKIIEDGEILINLPMIKDSFRPLGRALEMVAADRLATPLGKRGQGIFQGIELGDERQEPRRYWIRKAHKNVGDMELPSFEFSGIPARDGQGRPLILHIFATQQPGQARGVPHFAPVLKYFKNMADSLDAEVVAQKVAACLSAVIIRSDPTMNTFPTVTDPGTGKKLVKLEPGMVPTLGIGEDLKIIDFKKDGQTFDIFLTKVLRIIGNALGLPYELLLKDFSKTNYSSARAALLEAWRGFLYWRSWLTRKLCQPVWELVLEEAYLRGLFRVRDFYANRAEYCRAVWIGPGRGWVDPVKEIVAAKLEEDYNYATLADQCASQGRDWEDVLKQKAREMKRRKELGLPEPLAAQVQVVVPQETTGEQPNAPQ
jgi:lambda family phage portal protein